MSAGKQKACPREIFILVWEFVSLMSELKSAQGCSCALNPFSISKQIPEWMVLMWGPHPDVFHCLSKLSSLLDTNASSPGSHPNICVLFTGQLNIGARTDLGHLCVIMGQKQQFQDLALFEIPYTRLFLSAGCSGGWAGSPCVQCSCLCTFIWIHP